MHQHAPSSGCRQTDVTEANVDESALRPLRYSTNHTSVSGGITVLVLLTWYRRWLLRIAPSPRASTVRPRQRGATCVIDRPVSGRIFNQAAPLQCADHTIASVEPQRAAIAKSCRGRQFSALMQAAQLAQHRWRKTGVRPCGSRSRGVRHVASTGLRYWIAGPSSRRSTAVRLAAPQVLTARAPTEDRKAVPGVLAR